MNSLMNKHKRKNSVIARVDSTRNRIFTRVKPQSPRNNVFEQSFSTGNASFSHHNDISYNTNDQLEREADFFSERMINLSRTTVKSQPGSAHSSPQGSDVQKPLPGNIRTKFESHFGYDFSNVRIQNGSAAARETKQAGARAITAGNTIKFAPGEYQPDTYRGRKLLAHELSHVVQQDPVVEGDGLSNAPYGIPQHAEDNGLTVGPFEDLQSDRFSGVPELERAYDDKTLIYNGRSGDFVAIIQAALEDFGFPLTKYGIDGIFGSETESKVLEFQKAAGATMLDGIVGPETMNLLDQWAVNEEQQSKQTFLEKAFDHVSDEEELCILKYYERYLNGESIIGGIIRSNVDQYIFLNRGIHGPNWIRPSKIAKPAFYTRLDLYYNKSFERFMQEITDEVRRTREGFSEIVKRDSPKRHARGHTINRLIDYLLGRASRKNDIYYCFNEEVEGLKKFKIPESLLP